MRKRKVAKEIKPGFSVSHDATVTHPTMNEVRDIQIQASLALTSDDGTKLSWGQTVLCLNVVKEAILESLEWRLKSKEGGFIRVDYTQPFELSISLVQELGLEQEPKVHRTVKAQCFAEHADSLHDRLNAFFEQKLVRLFWGLKAIFNRKGAKASYFRFVLGFSAVEESATLEQLRGVVRRVEEEREEQRYANAGLVAPKRHKLIVPN